MSQGSKNPNEDFIMFALIIAGLALLSWLIWTLFHIQLIEALRWLRYGEMRLVAMINDPGYSIMYPGVGRQALQDWMNWLPNVPAEQIRLLDVKVMSALAVPPLRWIIVGLLALMAAIVIVSGPGTKFQRRFNLEALMREQAKSFPITAPFVKYNPLAGKSRSPGQAVPSRLPLFAEALSPEEWVAYNGITYRNGRLDADAAYRALYHQLGRRWQGVEKLSLPLQGLYAAFALKHVRKRKESEALLNALALAWVPGQGMKIPFGLRRKIKKAIKDPKVGGELKRYTDQHAFETTALLRALQRAREEGGVLAPATFLWLRGVEREIWYPLNNLGRKSYHAEASGALTHFTNELVTGQKIPTPRFDEILKVLEDYLRSPGARPIPPLEGIGRKKKVAS